MDKDNIDIITDGLDRIYKTVDGLKEDISRLNTKIDKIESHNSTLSEKLIRLETRYDAYCDMERNERERVLQTINDIFVKIRTKDEEVRSYVDSNIESANVKQDIRIIAKSVSIAVTIVTTIGVILRIVNII